MQELKLFENRLEQLATSLDGILDRIASLEERMQTGNALYVDAERALVSSRPADLDYIRGEIRKGNPRFKEYSR
jgi:hypothetical protein